MSKFEYIRLADADASEIANGGLKPGDRLPPQRSFAYERKIAVSTASERTSPTRACLAAQ